MILKDIKTPLTEEERRKLGVEIAEHVQRSEALEDQKRIQTADLSNAIKSERKAYRAKAKVLRDGHEYKPIECDEVQDFDRNVVLTKRRDTGEQVAERAMRSDERQQAIDFPGAEDAPVVLLNESAKKTRGKAGKESKEAH
jgi:hypothetical protein